MLEEAGKATMSTRKIILLALALITGVGTLYMARSLMTPPEPVVIQTQAPAPAPIPERSVLVARRDLPAGTLIRDNHLEWLPWPETEGELARYIVRQDQTIDDFFGSVVRRGIGAGEPVTEDRLVKPGEQGFLAAVLEPEHRAVSVSINPITGVAGFIFPGDRVDLILTHSIPYEGEMPIGERRVTETVLTDLRVLAIDQETNDQEATPRVGEIVTLEVEPKQAELVILMSQMGRLSLSLRSLVREDQEDEAPIASTPVAAAKRAAIQASTAKAMEGTDARPEKAQAPQVKRPRQKDMTAAERAAARRSSSERPYAWDSDVSRILPGPGTHRVRVMRGEVVAIEHFSN